MELEDLKQQWQAQEQKLNDHLNLNKEILKQVSFSRVNSTFKYMGVAEFLNLVVLLGVIIVYSSFSISSVGQPVYFWSGIATILISVIYLVLSSIEWVGYLQITSSNDTVLKKQKAVLVQMKRVGQFFVFEVALGLLFIVTATPMFLKLKQVDRWMDNLSVYFLSVAVASVISIVLCIVMYKYYMKKFKNAEEELKAIEEYEK
ncbi:MAG: hypothetical protein PHQ33_00475 [Bacteroidales bacterium]|jgi:hypothetical protein|nr:hypothetical protein [Bacteroidales bacterium]MDD4394356.1 hypothetical protein [Bacteroidales bacterium]